MPVEAEVSATDTTDTTEQGVVGKLSRLDRFLPVWIGVAMAARLLLGRLIPRLGDAPAAVEIDGISLPIAIGLLTMMYPVLAKVRYDRLDTITGDRRLLIGSLVLNWLLGPALMFVLAWLLLPDLPEYRTGLIIVGPARCIAMAIIWNDLACGAIMWGGDYLLGAAMGLGYERTTTLAFTAAGNNFELAIAVAIATYGATSGQALAGVVGPLIEVPVLVALAYVSLALRNRFRVPVAMAEARSR